MFGLFDSKKKKGVPAKTKAKATMKESSSPAAADGQDSKRAEILAQARASAAQAREAIGQDTLDQMVAIMEKQKKKSALEKAKAQIQGMDKDLVADHLRALIEEDKRR